MFRRLIGWFPAVALMVAIFIVSSRPAPEVIRHQYVPFQDKWLHLAAYFVLAVFFLRGLIGEGKGWTKKTLLLAAIFSSLYGLTDEIHQSFVPARTAGADDFLADILGSLLLFLFSNPLRRFFDWEAGFWRR